MSREFQPIRGSKSQSRGYIIALQEAIEVVRGLSEDLALENSSTLSQQDSNPYYTRRSFSNGE
jgi:hypothetical protein